MSSRRSSRLLRALYAIRRSRSTSRADGPGYLYAFNDRGGLWKIGMSNNFVRRKAEWDRRCPSSTRIWMPPIAVARRRRAETLAHLLLEMRSENTYGNLLVYYKSPVCVEENHSSVAYQSFKDVSILNERNM
ncbi:hypothetical protein FB446DRAFT_708397 [Lentinula raphanica]|nr:hypothetical protein FB446DRAFT_708397 [Lentinula raphanica]